MQKICIGCNPALAAGEAGTRGVAKARRSVKRPLMFVESTVEIVAVCRSDRAHAIGAIELPIRPAGFVSRWRGVVNFGRAQS